jgi:uncharacterized protein YeeX (DUF496 family)
VKAPLACTANGSDPSAAAKAACFRAGLKVNYPRRKNMQKKEIRETQLQIEDIEAILLLHALQEYICMKGHEINYSTECLRQKLDNYLLLQPSKTRSRYELQS